MGKQWKQWETLFSWAPNSLWTVTAGSHEIKKTLAPWKRSYDQPRQHIKKQKYSADKGAYSQSYVFPVVMCGCESWTIKKAGHQKTDGFELWCWRRLLRVHWAARRLNHSILKKNQHWIFIGRTDAKALILWPPDTKSQLIGMDPDAEKDWRQKEKGLTEDEMVR